MAHVDDDLGARVRAARGYAGLSQTQLADALGLERKAVGAIEANEERHELTVPEARRIAALTSVPISFLLHGWGTPPDLIERMDALERTLSSAQEERDALIARIDRLEDELQTQLASVIDEASTRAPTPADASDRPATRGR